MSVSLKIMLIALLVVAPYCRANCEQDVQCLNQGQWQFGIALGLGLASNPLKDGDNIPLLVLPDIAWYGDAAYFDNGELGYQWLENENTTFVTYMEFDKERAYFSFWHPANILSAITKTSHFVDVTSSAIEGPEKLSIDKITDRDWAILAGGRWYHHNGNNEWQISAVRDISNTHSGSKLILSYQRAWQWSNVNLRTEFALLWKSTKLLNYYYGVRQSDRVDPSFFYQAKGGWQPVVSISLQKKINEKWQWINKASFQKLNKGMTQSPLVEENNLYLFFSGFAYHF